LRTWNYSPVIGKTFVVILSKVRRFEGSKGAGSNNDWLSTTARPFVAFEERTQ